MVGRFRILFLVALFVSAGRIAAQEVRLSAKVDSTEYKLGDCVDVHVDGVLAASVDSIRPAFSDSVGTFEVVKVERAGAEPRWLVRIFSLDSGRVFIPPLQFVYRLAKDTSARMAQTNPLFVTFTGIPIDAQGEIKDIKPPVNAPWKFEDYLPYLIALVIIGALVGAYLWYRKVKARREASYVPPKPVMPPHELALFQLRELEDRKLWQQGKVKEFYSEATEIIRRFFEGRWNIVALELTSDEIFEKLKTIPESAPVAKTMNSFFTTADLVKFAKYTPSPIDHENELRWAYEIVRSMIPVHTAVVEEQTPEAANVR